MWVGSAREVNIYTSLIMIDPHTVWSRLSYWVWWGSAFILSRRGVRRHNLCCGPDTASRYICPLLCPLGGRRLGQNTLGMYLNTVCWPRPLAVRACLDHVPHLWAITRSFQRPCTTLIKSAPLSGDGQVSLWAPTTRVGRCGQGRARRAGQHLRARQMFA